MHIVSSSFSKSLNFCASKWIPFFVTSKLLSSSPSATILLRTLIVNFKNDFLYCSTATLILTSFKKDISTLRTGRANINMLDTIKVDVYGQLMPIEQLATVSVPEARLISIQVWDKANTGIIESSIQKSELGINPQVDGQVIRLRIPDLTEERRNDLIKVLKNMGEKRQSSN